MSHELEFVNGEAQTFYVGEKPWHKLGKQLFFPPTIIEAIVAAGLDWEVGLHEMKVLGYDLHDTEYKTKIDIPDHKAVIRQTDNKVLGVVGNKYTPLQNNEAFEWFQPFIDSGLVELDTAGSLFGGRKVWILARIKQDPIEIQKNDPVERYILLSNSHDGSMAITAGFTPIRVVCNNTLSFADNKDAKLLKFKHTENAKLSLDKVRDIMDVANRRFEATAEDYRYLASKVINHETFQRYVLEVLEKDKEEEVSTRTLNQLEKIEWLWECGKGNDGKTVWSAYNAITEYMGNENSDSLDKVYQSLWFGANQKRNTFALNKALKIN